MTDEGSDRGFLFCEETEIFDGLFLDGKGGGGEVFKERTDGGSLRGRDWGIVGVGGGGGGREGNIVLRAPLGYHAADKVVGGESRVCEDLLGLWTCSVAGV